jgi:hypothetical protein
MSVRLAALVAGGVRQAWEALGFAVDGAGAIAFGNGAIELHESRELRLYGLQVTGLDGDADLEGIPLTAGDLRPPAEHGNGCFELDHVVILTDDLDRTSAAVEALLGLARRRLRQTADVRQAFHRFEDRGCIVELVENERVRTTRLYGLVVNTPDLERVCTELGHDLIGRPKPAVQPGRLIATVRESAGLGFPVALMTPSA